MFKCYHCGCESVAWVGDYSFDECGFDGNGLIQLFSCASCGAEIEVRIENDSKPLSVGRDERKE